MLRIIIMYSSVMDVALHRSKDFLSVTEQSIRQSANLLIMKH